MKKIIIILLSIVSSQSLFANTIFTRGDTNGVDCHKLDLKLNRILNESEKDIIFYVHGRGQHPEKGISYLPDFEDAYNAKVIMFHWKSWINWYSRPEDSAKESGSKLRECLDILNKYKIENKEKFSKRKTFFMAHSMGNIVFKNLMEYHYQKDNWAEDLFNAVIMNAPDVKSKKHNTWVDKIDFTKKRYITINDDDFILIGSKAIDVKDVKIFKGARLGASIHSKKSISKKTMYMDFSKISLGGHRYFLDKDKNAPIMKIYRYILEIEKDLSVPYYKNRKYSNILKFK